MKRTAMRRKKTQRLSDYDAEFEAMKPFIRARSNNRCEVSRLVREHIERLVAQGRKADADEASKAALEMMESHHCGWVGTHVHHRKYRSRGGSNHPSNLAHTCGACHAWIHAHGGFGEPANVLRLALSAGESEEL